MEKEEWAKDPVLSKVEFLKQSDLLKVLNGTYISKRFFGKSASWFNQKLTNQMKNGSPAEFTPKEIETLKNALEVLSIELITLADEL